MGYDDICRASSSIRKGRVHDGRRRSARRCGIMPADIREPSRFGHGYYLMSALFQKTGNLEKALAFAELAIKHAPEIALFHSQQGQICISSMQWAPATAAFEKARILEPDNVHHVLLQAHATMQQQRYDEADTLYAKARQLAPDYPRDRRAAGNAFHDKGRLR